MVSSLFLHKNELLFSMALGGRGEKNCCVWLPRQKGRVKCGHVGIHTPPAIVLSSWQDRSLIPTEIKWGKLM